MDILTGGDFYWNFICDSFRRGDSGSIALLTKVGYDLGGPIEEVTNNVHSDFISSHVMKTQATIKKKNKNLQSTMKTFWANGILGTLKRLFYKLAYTQRIVM